MSNKDTIALAVRLSKLGFEASEISTLRRIARALHRWNELECGDGNNYASWAIERDEDVSYTCTQCGHRGFGEGNCEKCGDPAPVRHVGDGKPYMVRHVYGHSNYPDQMIKTPIADKET